MKRSKITSQVTDLIKLFGSTPSKNDDLEELFLYLRVNIKYTLLDLEATRRERDAKRQ